MDCWRDRITDRSTLIRQKFSIVTGFIFAMNVAIFLLPAGQIIIDANPLCLQFVLKRFTRYEGTRALV